MVRVSVIGSVVVAEAIMLVSFCVPLKFRLTNPLSSRRAKRSTEPKTQHFTLFCHAFAARFLFGGKSNTILFVNNTNGVA